MEKRVVIAAAISIGILVLWGKLFPQPKHEPPPPPPMTESAPAEAGATGAEGPTGPALDAAPAQAEVEADAPPETAPVGAQTVQEFVVETALFRVTVSNDGGRLVSWKLREYTSSDGEPLELLPQLDGAAPRMMTVDLDDAELAETFNGALYSIERLETGSTERIVFEWSDGRGLEARKTLSFDEGSYLVGAELELLDRGRRLPARLVLGPGFGAQENGKSHSTYYYSGQAAWDRAGSVTRLKSKKMAEPGGFQGDVQWVGLEDQYFAALVLPGAGESQVAWRSIEVRLPGAEADADPVTKPLLAVSLPGEGARLYVGPKKYTLLRELGLGLDKAVWFATNPFLAWIARFIFLCLIWIHDHTISNYGLAIVLSTFLLRLLLFPVNQYSMVSMKKTQLQMQKLQPKIKRIREKYKKAKDAESRGKMNQEMMELYRAEGVNPMGGLNGCLPLMAQFPILIGFYNMLTVAVELRGAPFFGWIHDLSQADPYYITPLLMGVTMFLQQRMAMSRVKDPVQAQQQKIMMVMPVVFTYICVQMPAGMVLYWFVNNLLGMGQQWLVNRHTSRLEAAEQGA